MMNFRERIKFKKNVFIIEKKLKKFSFLKRSKIILRKKKKTILYIPWCQYKNIGMHGSRYRHIVSCIWIFQTLAQIVMKIWWKCLERNVVIRGPAFFLYFLQLSELFTEQKLFSIRSMFSKKCFQRKFWRSCVINFQYFVKVSHVIII